MSGQPSLKTPMTHVTQKILPFFAILLLLGCSSGEPAPVAQNASAVTPPPLALNQLAAKCQGDFTRLSPDEQKTVQGMTSGKGAEAMAALFKSPSRP